jgi:hypothetical protein
MSVARIRRDIAERGVHVEHVLVPPGGAWFPDRSYSVGLAVRGRHPEVLVYAWHHDDRAALIERIARAVAAGRRFAAGEVATDLWEGERFGFLAVRVAEVTALAPAAVRFHGRPVPVLQVLVPDDHGRLPGEAAYDRSFARWQPLAGPLASAGDQARAGL